MADSLAEYLIPISYRVDTQSQDKMRSAVREGALQANLLADAITSAVTKFGGMMVTITDQLNDLFYASQRTKDSVTNMEALGRAADRTGSSAASARASFEGFAKYLRDTGAAGDEFSRGMAQIDAATWKTLTNSEKINATIKGIVKTYPSNLQNAVRDQLHITEDYFLAVKNNGLLDEADRQKGILRAAGLDPDHAARDMQQFKNAMLDFRDTLDTVFEKVASNFAHGGGAAALREFDQWLIDHSGEIATAITGFTTGLLDFIKAVEPLAVKLDGAIKSTIGWEKAFEGLGIVLLSRVIPGLTTTIGLLERMIALSLPPWMLGLLAAGGAGYEGYQLYQHPGDVLGHLNPLQNNDARARELWNRDHPGQSYPADAPQGESGLWGSAKRVWQNRPTWLGGTGGAAADMPSGSDAGSLTKLINDEAARAGIDPRIMQGIRAGESGHGINYDVKDDNLESSWGPFQLNRRRGLGAQFERETGLDVRNPGTIAAQTRWVANFLAKGGSLGNWMGYHGPREADPRWGNSGYRPTPSVPAYSPGWSLSGSALAAPATSPIMDMWSSGKAFQTPLGVPGPQSFDNSNSSTIAPVLNQKTSIIFNGNVDGHVELGAKVARMQNNVNADAIRNLQSNAVG